MSVMLENIILLSDLVIEKTLKCEDKDLSIIFTSLQESSYNRNLKQ